MLCQLLFKVEENDLLELTSFGNVDDISDLDKCNHLEVVEMKV